MTLRAITDTEDRIEDDIIKHNAAQVFTGGADTVRFPLPSLVSDSDLYFLLSTSSRSQISHHSSSPWSKTPTFNEKLKKKSIVWLGTIGYLIFLIDRTCRILKLS